MEKQFSTEELRCLKNAVDYCLAMQDMWDNEYVISKSESNLKGSDIVTLNILKFKLETA